MTLKRKNFHALNTSHKYWSKRKGRLTPLFYPEIVLSVFCKCWISGKVAIMVLKSNEMMTSAVYKIDV